MKKIIAIIAIMLSTQAAAQKPAENVLARYAFHTVSDLTGGSKYALVKYLEDGVLVVDHYLYSTQNGYQGELLGTSEIYLPESVASRILDSIKSLSGAELVEHTADVVCMMMPLPGPDRNLLVRRGWDWQSKSFTGDLAIVKTNTGCWDPYSVYPTHEWHRMEARGLMNTLEIATLMALDGAVAQ